MRVLTPALLPALALLLVPHAQAQRGSVSVNIGYGSYTTYDDAGDTYGEGGGGMAMVRIRAVASERFSADLSGFTHYITESRAGTIPIERVGSPLGLGSEWLAGLDLGVEYALLPGDLRPTVAVGIGMATLSGSGSLDFRDIFFQSFAGVGATYHINRWAMVRADARVRRGVGENSREVRGGDVSGGFGVKF